jgi:hypothetical protein
VVDAKIRKELVLLRRPARRDNAEIVSAAAGQIGKLAAMLPECGTRDELMGIEGAAAREYLGALGEWGAATQKSVVCRPQQGGYRCPWSYQLNGAHHSGYVLVAVTANNYRLGQVAEVGQAAPASPASSLSPLWYIPIAAVAVIVAVVAVLLWRRRATATAQ